MRARSFYIRGLIAVASAVVAFAGSVSPVSAGPTATLSVSATCNEADSTDIVGGDWTVDPGLKPDGFADASLTVTVTNGGMNQLDYIHVDHYGDTGGYWETTNSTSSTPAFLLGVTRTRTLGLLNGTDGSFTPTLRKTTSWRVWFTKAYYFYVTGDAYKVYVVLADGSSYDASCTAP